jgi:hypothetical protein
LTNFPDKCKKSDECLWDDAKKICEETTLKGSCGVLQDPGVCTRSPLRCDWDSSKNPPLCVPKNPDVAIFEWSKFSDPITAAAPQFHHIVASKNNDATNVYALNAAPHQVGLWHTKDGVAWTLTQLSGKPNADIATAAVNLTISADDIINNKIKLHATNDGAVIQSDKVIMILSGNQVVWALDTTQHHKPEFADVENKNISFSSIVNVKIGPALKEVILLQQEDNNNIIHIADWVNNTFNTNITTLKKADNTPIEMRLALAINDDANGLIVGGRQQEKVLGLVATEYWAIYQVPEAHTDIANDDFGIIEHDRPVLESNREGFNQNKGWPNDSVLTFAGKLGSRYFVNLDAPSLNRFGILSHDGPQTGDLQLTFASSQEAQKPKSIIKFDNSIFVKVEGAGYLGANQALEPEAAQNFNFDRFATLNEMMVRDHKQAPPALINEDLILILGNTSKAYFVLKGPQAGIYSRIQTQGQPRFN